MNSDPQLTLFCENLLHLRRKHGLSKTEMARILGIGVKTLTFLERGSVSPRLGSSVLVRASVYFDLKCDDLLRSRQE